MLRSGFLFCLFLITSFTSRADVAIRDIQINTPRTYAYFIGDMIRHEVILTLNQPFQLSPESLPEPGQIDYWLQLYPIVIQQQQLDSGQATRYAIQFNYQLINISENLTTLAIPEIKIQFSDGQGTLAATVPAWRFQANPMIAADDWSEQLQASNTPTLRQFNGNSIFIAALLLLIALLILIYLYLPAWISNSPFSRALKTLKQLQQQSWNLENYQTALRTVHQAFNQTAGETVFHDDLKRFFEIQPKFKTLQQPIEHFFQRSQSIFFTDQHTIDTSAYSLNALQGLCSQCRDIERSLA